MTLDQFPMRKKFIDFPAPIASYQNVIRPVFAAAGNRAWDHEVEYLYVAVDIYSKSEYLRRTLAD